ncbi:choice-of-anchor B family protein [bacterium]|nr:choice-of-anchor B family protein [bacterium]
MPITPTRWACARVLLAAAFVLAACIPAQAQLFDFDNMVLLGRHDLYDGYNDVWGFVGTDGREYIVQGTTTGTAWWDVEDPYNAVFIDFIPGPGSLWRDMFVIGNYCYVGTEGGGGIQIVDISDPTNPTLVNTYNATVSSSHNVFGDPSRNLLFVVGSAEAGGLQILDTTDPVNLVEIGSWTNQYIHDISIEGNLAYVSLINFGRFRLLDLSDSTNPTNYGTPFFDNADHACWPFGDGTHVAISQESNGGHIKIVDVSNPNAITLVDESNPAPGASMHNVHIEGTRMYCSWYARGTRVYDVSVPSAIAEIGYFDTYPPSDGGGVGPGNWGVYPHLPSGTIAANDGTYGLFLMRYDVNAATLDGTVSSSATGLLAGADVVFGSQQILTAAGGAYKFSSEPGAQSIDVSAFGHQPQTLNVNAIAGGTTTTNVTLTKLPAGGLAGTITETGSGTPINGTDITIVGTPLTTQSDGAGNYSFPDVPTSPSPTYTLDVARPGYAPVSIQVTLSTGVVTTKDIELTPSAEYVDFSSTAGWSVTSDPATTSGFWEFGEPVGTGGGGDPYQPEFDHTPNPEDQCAVTGNTGGGIGDDDVDGGATRLFSPVYDLSAMTEPHVFYYRTYAVNSNADAWQTHVTTNGGGSWDLIDSTTSHEPAWTPINVDLTAVAGGASAVQFRFTCEDPDPGQVVEGALDDFFLYDGGGSATGVVLPERAFSLALAQNSPNPFPLSTRVRFAIPSEQHVVLSVFDVAGRRVATLIDGALPAGEHAAEWDGRTIGGNRATAGVYFTKLQTKNGFRTRKMVMVR